ncbi:MAG: FAD-binding oxidoreductase [Streptosporangiaceae bacterium]
MPGPGASTGEGISGAEVAVALAGTGAVVGDAGPADAVAGVRPACVAYPGTLEQAAGLLQAAASLGMTVVPRGSGRRISWGPPPARCDVVADMTRMNRVIEHAAGDLVLRAAAGVTLGELSGVLAAKGQRLALDAPAAATVGGVVAAGTAGPLRLRYGTPRDLLIGITVVRPDGRVAHSGGKVVKNVAGYDIGKLFAGSLGTLGLITEATFRLHPLAALSAYVTRHYDDAAAAAEAVLAAAASPLQAAAAEIERDGPGAPVQVGILLEGTPDGVSERAERMAALLGHGAQTALTPPGWWAARGEAAPGAVGGTLIRVAFWAAELRRVLDAIDLVATETGLRPAAGGSAGAGVLYVGLDAGQDAGQVAVFIRALRAATGHGGVQDPGALARGSVVVLTAPAAVRASVDMWGPVPGLELMRAVKRQFDPANTMAPGRFAGGI